MPNKTTNPQLSSIAAQASRSAVFGFAASAGRDAWRSVKMGSSGVLFWIVVLAAITFPFIGGRNLVQGYPANAFWQATRGYLLGLMLISLGTAPAFGVAFIFVALFTKLPLKMKTFSKNWKWSRPARKKFRTLIVTILPYASWNVLTRRWSFWLLGNETSART